MNDKEVVEVITEIAKQRSKDVYDDGLKPATQQAGEVLGTIVGFFNNVVLYPMKKVNMDYINKLETFSKELEERSSKIPDDKLIVPRMNVLDPTIEALKYNYDEDELKDMYLELLSSAMNSDKAVKAHPSYVDIVKSLSGYDAIILKRITGMNPCPMSNTVIGYENKLFAFATPKNFVPELLEENDDPFIVSSSIDNLSRLGILMVSGNTVINYDYDVHKSHPYIVETCDEIKKVKPDLELVIKVNRHTLSLTDFGRNFAEVCIPSENG